MSAKSPIDHIEREWMLGRMTKPDAVKAVRAVVDVTDLGAADLLDNRVPPRQRYEEARDAVVAALAALAADTCRPGDPDPEPAGDERPRCTSRSHGFGCTRVIPHTGKQHEAGGGTVVHATWDYEGGNFRDETGAAIWNP